MAVHFKYQKSKVKIQMYEAHTYAVMEWSMTAIINWESLFL